jgi:2',3'-cyclic-nucleotide 2'-phosphodiesterase (5'-nucleotidase family)
MTVRILHTNDFHGMLDEAREAHLQVLRRDCDFYFDCGDAIKSGNLAVPLRPEEAWKHLASLDCSASVPGNRESHVLAGAFAKKIEGHRHPIVCANMHLKSGLQPLPGYLLFEHGSLRVGVVGVMVAMVTKRMATQAASAYLWDPPIPKAIAVGEELRPNVDLLIALTHIGLRQDRELASQWGGFDLILGGHSHDVLQEPVVVGKTAICQTGSHGRFAGVYEWDSGSGLAEHKLAPLTPSAR